MQRDLEIKGITFQKLDWENIISINTNGRCDFSAVDRAKTGNGDSSTIRGNSAG